MYRADRVLGAPCRGSQVLTLRCWTRGGFPGAVGEIEFNSGKIRRRSPCVCGLSDRNGEGRTY